MEEKKVCHACKSNQVARSYQNGKNAPVEFYCLECYSRLFLECNEDSATVCPYCGMTLASVRLGKLVGCAHCYQAMWSGIFPLVEKMQGVRGHRGKTPPIEEYVGSMDASTFYLEISPRQKASTAKRCNELFILATKLREEGDEEGAKYYEERRAALQNGLLKEDFAWRTQRSLSKQS